MIWHPISRRHFLIGAGGFALSLPLLPSLSFAKASTAAVDKRFVAIWSPFGQYRRLYWPATEAQTVLGPDVLSHPLSEIPGGISNILKSDLFGSLHSKLLLLRGLDCTTTQGHNFNVMLGADRNYSTHVTIDNVLSQSAKVYPQEPMIRALHLRPTWNDGQDGKRGISFAKMGSQISMVPNYWSAEAAFNRMFYGKTEKEGLREKVVDRVYA